MAMGQEDTFHNGIGGKDFEKLMVLCDLEDQTPHTSKSVSRYHDLDVYLYVFWQTVNCCCGGQAGERLLFFLWTVLKLPLEDCCF